MSCFLMPWSETELVWRASPADISMREPLWCPTLWAEQTHAHGSPRCVRAPPSALLPYPDSPQHPQAASSGYCLCLSLQLQCHWPLASPSLLLQHSVDCLTHRKWQVNISCTERLARGSSVAPAAASLRWSRGWQPRDQPAASPDPHPVNLSISLWSPLTKIFYSV